MLPLRYAAPFQLICFSVLILKLFSRQVQAEEVFDRRQVEGGHQQRVQHPAAEQAHPRQPQPALRGYTKYEPPVVVGTRSCYLQLKNSFYNAQHCTAVFRYYLLPSRLSW